MANLMIVKRINAWSVAKIESGLMFVIGFLTALSQWLMFLLLGALASGSATTQSGSFSLFAKLGFLWVIILAVLMGLMGLIGGALAAWIYNLMARWFGGIKIELSPEADKPVSP